MIRVRTILFASVLLALPASANAQYAVIDATAIAKQVEQIAQLKNQLETMKKQLDQAKELYDSANGLTNLSDVAGLLNDPAIRKALPENFSDVEGLLSGSGSGGLGSMAERHLEGNSTYRPSANDFYAQELARVQKRNAGELSLGEQMYDTATKRIDGLDELRKKISKSSDQKEVAALSARIQSESAMLQNDMLRMQALKMVQDAQSKVEDQRAREQWRAKLDRMDEALK